MLTVPQIVDRPEEPCLAIPVRVTMATLGQIAPATLDELQAWMAERGLPSGVPFFRYRTIDMARELALDVGVVTPEPVPGKGRVAAGTIPAGRYASIVHTGPYDALYDVNAVLIGWAKERGLRWDSRATPEGERFAGRFEFYRTDPDKEPDSARWVTELAIKLAPPT